MAYPRILALCCALIFFGGTNSSLFAQGDPSSFRFEKVASWPGFARGETRDLVVVNGKAYMAMGDGGLCIADYSNPASPTVLSRLDLDGSSEVIKVAGNYAYLCSGTAGLHIVNIANPSAPTLAARYNTGANIKEIAFIESLGFLAAGTEGVIALNLANPAAPVRLGSYDTKGEGLDVEGYTIFNGSGVAVRRTLWVADGTNGIVYLDALDPSNIRLVQTDATEGTISVARQGRYVLFLDSHPSSSTSSLWFKDAQYAGSFGPDSPAGFFNFASRKFNLHLDTTGVPDGAFVQSTGGSLYNAGFKISPFTGQGVQSYGGAPSTNPTTALGAASEGTNNYFSVSTVGIQVMGGTNVLGVFIPGGSANRVRLAGDRVYLGDTYQGLHILQANSDGTVAKLSTYYAGYQRGFAVSGSTVFLTTSTNVHVVDVSNGAQPTLLSNLAPVITNKPTTLSLRDVAVADNRLYVAGIIAPLSIFDVTQPAQPTLLRLNSSGGINSILVRGTNLFTSGGGFGVLGVDPTYRTTLLKSDASFAAAVTLDLAGSTAYFPDRANGLRIFDIFNPANFALRSTIDTPGTAVAVKIVGNLAFVADTESGVSVVDVTDRDHPFVRARLATPNNALDVQVRDNLVYVANGAEGLTVWKMIPVAGQHIDFPPIDDASVIDDPFPIAATASSGLPVQLSVTGPATISNGYLVLTGAQGTVRVTATQPGNNDFVSATAERSFVVRTLFGALDAYLYAADPNLPLDQTGPDADPDHDGAPNIVEFFFRSNPVGGDSLVGHTTASILEFFGDYYLVAHYPKPRTSKYEMSIQVGEFNEPAPRNWISYPASFNADGYGDFVWPISNDGSFPLIRLALKYP